MNHRLVWAAALVACAQGQTPGVIAYTRAPAGAPPWPVQDVCTMRADGSTEQCLTSDGHSHHPSWSPDGKRILFIHDSALSTQPPYRETEDSKSHHPIELSVMDANGRNRRVLRVIEPVIYSAAWSPKGATLAVSAATSAAPGESPSVGLFLLPANGTGELRLLRPNAWTPSWSPDGTKLAFTVEQPRGHWTVHTANGDGTNEVRLTDPSVNSGSPAWSPDGKSIAFDQFTNVNGRQQVFVMNADGSSVRQLTTDTAWSCVHPTWSSSGSQLVVACRSAASFCGMGVFSTGQPMPECTRRLFVVPVASGAAATPTKLMDHDGAIPSFTPR
jgi:Tol biopolymer transport system component